jgi:hypothetical protein
MISTRHEKIAIVLASYVIGFTTAFIAFGVTKMGEKEVYPNNSSYIKVVSYKDVHKNISDIGTDDDGLYVTVGGYKRTISSYRSLLPASVIESTELVGYAAAHFTPVVSNDGWSAFYCEQEEESSADCTPYVYSLFDDTIHTVRLNGEVAPLNIGQYTVSWTDENRLSINGFASVSSDTPWLFVQEAVAEVVGQDAIQEATETENQAKVGDIQDANSDAEVVPDALLTDEDVVPEGVQVQ